MQEQKLKDLIQLVTILKKDNVSSQDIERFLVLVLDVIKKAKENLDESAKKVLAQMKDGVIFSQFEQEQTLKKVRQENAVILSNFNLKMAQVESILEEVRSLTPTIDENAIIENVLSQIPTLKIEEKTPEQTRDKLESLKGDDRLDKSAIKGLENAKVNKDGSIKVIGGQSGLRLFVDEAKFGLVKALDFKAGTGVTLTHTKVNGLDTITIDSTGGSGGTATSTYYEEVTAVQSGSDVTIDLTQLAHTFGSLLFTTRQGQILQAGTGTNQYSISSTTLTIYGADAATEWFGVMYAVGTTTTYNIVSSTGSNGTISPLGTTSVTSGASQAYTITPDSGYAVSDVLVDGVSVGAVSTYQFTNVVATHTISVTFSAVVVPGDTWGTEDGNEFGTEDGNKFGVE